MRNSYSQAHRYLQLDSIEPLQTLLCSPKNHDLTCTSSLIGRDIFVRDTSNPPNVAPTPSENPTSSHRDRLLSVPADTEPDRSALTEIGGISFENDPVNLSQYTSETSCLSKTYGLIENVYTTSSSSCTSDCPTIRLLTWSRSKICTRASTAARTASVKPTMRRFRIAEKYHCV